MNKQRRKALSEIIDRVAMLHATLSAICDDLDALREEEQEAYVNLPEAMQEGERGQAMSQALDDMQASCYDLDALCNALDEINLDALQAQIDDARGQS